MVWDHTPISYTIPYLSDHYIELLYNVLRIYKLANVNKISNIIASSRKDIEYFTRYSILIIL